MALETCSKLFWKSPSLKDSSAALNKGSEHRKKANKSTTTGQPDQGALHTPAKSAARWKKSWADRCIDCIVIRWMIEAGVRSCGAGFFVGDSYGHLLRVVAANLKGRQLVEVDSPV